MIYDGIVFYSCFFPDKKNIFRGEEFLETIKNNFKNYLVFIGTQSQTTKYWFDILEKYKEIGLNIIYDKCNPNLYVNSDVAGYQKALELFFNIKKNIKIKNDSLIWFGHSKGVTTNEISYHNWVFNNFWGKRETIESRLLENEKYGCYGTHLSFLPIYDTTKVKEIWRTYCGLKFTNEPLKFMFVNTFFVVKSKIFLELMENLNTDFLHKKINGVHGGNGDRYFFERDFIHFVDMMGYEPLFEEYAPNISWSSLNPLEYIVHLNEWKNKNNVYEK
jgi:hypothetical protein